MKTVIFGAGCFWCIEALFSRIKGVKSVMPGYAGGTTPDPSYEQVCDGDTGHAEVAKIEYDEKEISFKVLLKVFFEIHDPTSLNQQGNDFGTQYRSIILYTSEEQKKEIEEFIPAYAKATAGKGKIVTEVKHLEKFYPAEDYHKKYFEKNQDAPYCQFVILPKVKKLEEESSELVVE